MKVAQDEQEFMALNGGPEFKFSEVAFLYINCADQAEVDHYWSVLTKGNEVSQYGWLAVIGMMASINRGVTNGPSF
jgi:predicted 3-demethylubiquinone-9 3-methyltransferase (glyoxalase superfamily)